MADIGAQQFPRAVEAIEQSIQRGLSPGAQVYVSQNAQPLADFARGDAQPGIPMTPDSITMWLSAVKPVTAVAIGQLIDRARLTLDQQVAEIIPAFGASGKGAVTIRHLLEHTAGLRFVAARWTPDPWAQIIGQICNAPLEKGWVPGEHAGYHVASTWYILGEIVRKLDGRRVDEYVRDEIFLPLGMSDSWLATPREQYAAYGERIAPTYITEKHQLEEQPAWSSAEGAVQCRPGGSGRGPIRELGWFYEHMLSIKSGTPGIIRQETLESLTARSRINKFDRTFNHMMDWGTGFMVDSKHHGVETVPYGFGRHCSSRAFGHAGYQSSTGFADPEHGLVVALIFNGTAGEEEHQKRLRAVCNAIYEDVGISSASPESVG